MAVSKRELFKPPDVCEIAQLQPYVLRSWEAEFPTLGQPTTAGGPRVYRKSDVEMVLRIKQLVFGEGLTLAGARRRLEEEDAPSVAVVAVEDVLGDMARSRLRQVRTGLESIMRLLSRDIERRELELQLVPPPSAAPAARGRTAIKRSTARSGNGAKTLVKSAHGKRRRAS